MGDLLGAYRSVSSEKRNNSFEAISAYEEHYMKLLKKYAPEIQEIEHMMQNLREERKRFYFEELPQIQRTMTADIILSEENKAEWLRQLQENMEHSFQISESLIQHYITKNLEEYDTTNQIESKEIIDIIKY